LGKVVLWKSTIFFFKEKQNITLEFVMHWSKNRNEENGKPIDNNKIEQSTEENKTKLWFRGSGPGNGAYFSLCWNLINFLILWTKLRGYLAYREKKIRYKSKWSFTFTRNAVEWKVVVIIHSWIQYLKIFLYNLIVSNYNV